MNVTKKLEIFSNVSIREAKRKNKEVLDEIENKFKKACSDYEKKAKKVAESTLIKETYKAEQIKNKDVMEAMQSERKKLIDLRNELTQNIFDSVQDNISKFINSDNYKKYLIKQIENIKKLYGSDIKVFIMERDKGYESLIHSLIDINIECVKEDFIGGCKVIVNNRNIIIDNTIKSKLVEARNSFNVFKIVD